MKRKGLTSGKDHVESADADQLGRKVKPADIIWVKNHGSSWWPAQVVNENFISEGSKPGNRSAGRGKVLVRLYGTYTYSYVDPIKCRFEFDTILKQNNDSYKEIFLKALEQDVARLNAGESKRQRSKSKDVVERKMKPKSSSTKQHDEGESKKNLTRNSASSVEMKKRKIKQDDRGTGEAASNTTPKHDKETISFAKSQELSARRLRVMQSLGLAAPTGSPFSKNWTNIYNSLT